MNYYDTYEPIEKRIITKDPNRIDHRENKWLTTNRGTFIGRRYYCRRQHQFTTAGSYTIELKLGCEEVHFVGITGAGGNGASKFYGPHNPFNNGRWIDDPRLLTCGGGSGATLLDAYLPTYGGETITINIGKGGAKDGAGDDTTILVDGEIIVRAQGGAAANNLLDKIPTVNTRIGGYILDGNISSYNSLDGKGAPSHYHGGGIPNGSSAIRCRRFEDKKQNEMICMNCTSIHTIGHMNYTSIHTEHMNIRNNDWICNECINNNLTSKRVTENETNGKLGSGGAGIVLDPTIPGNTLSYGVDINTWGLLSPCRTGGGIGGDGCVFLEYIDNDY